MGNALAWTPCSDYFTPARPSWLKPERTIRVEYCKHCSFRPKAEYFCGALQQRCDKLWRDKGRYVKVDANPVDQKGRMQVFVDGAMLYSKQAGLVVDNPQPTPSEAVELLGQLFESAPFTASEMAAYGKLHASQMEKVQTPTQ
jgi:hypothetical protein